MKSLRSLPRRWRIVAHLWSLMLLLAQPAAACPTCSVGQAIETLALVMAFMAIPYVIVTGVWFWIKRLLAGEELDA